MRTRVKICGLTRAEDVAVAVACGADALGLIFFPPSARAVDVDQAASLADSVPALVDLVGVFVDPNEKEVFTLLIKLGMMIESRVARAGNPRATIFLPGVLRFLYS